MTDEKRHSSTLEACSENRAKLTPPPSHVAPSGFGLPGQTLGSISLSQSVKKFLSNPVVDHYRHTLWNSVCTNEQSIAYFDNISTNAVSYNWSFGDGSANSSVTNPSHTYKITEDNNSFNVILVATSAGGCSDTSIVTIGVYQNVSYFVPNSFTPDGDLFNNEFKPIFNSEVSEDNYSLLIFNRWGEVIFESKNKNIGWDGTFGPDKIKCQSNVYSWKIEFSKNSNDERIRLVGHVNLLR